MGKAFFNFKNFLLLFLILLFGTSSYYFITLGINDYEMKSTSYEYQSDINYRVFLKENNFFEEKYLTKDSEYKVFISSLIDYIDVDFTYNLAFDSIVSGNYKYYVIATISAESSSSSTKDNYWSKSYTLLEPKEYTYDKTNGFSLAANVKVNYQEYNEILKEFKSTYGISADGNLKITLVVESNSESSHVGKEIPVTSKTTSLNIPLTQQTIDLSIDEESDSNSDTISEIVKLMDNVHIIFFIIGVSLALITLLLIYTLVSVVIAKVKGMSYYTKTINKILTTYDSIIVNVSTLPNYEGYDIIKVKEFSELIDAHSEVRKPINYFKVPNERKAIFVLISEGIAWEYTLEDNKKR